MRAEELMSDAKCCKPDDTVLDCARLMRDQNIGFVPICNDASAPIGAITDRDLVIRVLADGRSAEEKLEAFMTRDVIACELGDDVKDVEQTMRDQRKSRVMVCDDQGKLRGVISLADIADAESEQELGETVQQVKSDQPPAH